MGSGFDVQVLATRLRELRAKKNVSQQQVADATGISQMSISMYEQGRTAGGPSFETACLLADYYGVSLAYLGGRTDYEPETA